VTRVDQKERFQKVGMEAEYFSVWKYLSAHIHNTMSALRNRHLQESTDGEAQLVSSVGHTPFFGSAIIMACNTLLDCSEVMHDRYGEGRKVFAKIRKVSDALHVAALPDPPELG
jgi:hypothetical protein